MVINIRTARQSRGAMGIDREVLKQKLPREEMEKELLAAGFMPEALEGLLKWC